MGLPKKHRVNQQPEWRPLRMGKIVECKGCGYEPENPSKPGICPKCHSTSWNNYQSPGGFVPVEEREKSIRK